MRASAGSTVVGASLAAPRATPVMFAATPAMLHAAMVAVLGATRSLAMTGLFVVAAMFAMMDLFVLAAVLGDSLLVLPGEVL